MANLSSVYLHEKIRTDLMNSKLKKILHYSRQVFIPGLPGFENIEGGLPRTVWNSMEGLPGNGTDHFLLTMIPSRERQHKNIHILPVPGQVFSPSNFRGWKRALCSLRGKEPFWSYKMIPSFFFEDYFDHAIRSIDPDLIHFHQLNLKNLPLLRRALEIGIPLAVTLHGPDCFYPVIPDGKLQERKYLEKRMEMRTIEYLNGRKVPVLCVGGVMKQKILNNLHIAYPEKIYPLPNGYDPEIFRFYSKEEGAEIRKARSIPTDARVVISIGTLTTRKNHGFLIRSLSKLSEKEQARVICLIVGGGYRRRRLEKLARDLNFRGKVIFLGDIGGEEVARFLAVSDIMALVSFSEGLSRTVLESLAVGTPVLSFTDLFSEEEKLLKKGMFLVNRDTPEAFSDAIKQSLEFRWDRRSVSESVQGFHWQNVSQRYMEIFHEIFSDFNALTERN
ncbi:MAG: glycosyltransferase family 4 protein [Synergistales bacterium]|nr:glycosyltransferase family 4 protein [Synergistales bacterium]